MTHDTYTQLVALLASPDPPEMPVRGHRLTQPGGSSREQQAKWIALAVRWRNGRQPVQDEIGSTTSERKPLRLVARR